MSFLDFLQSVASGQTQTNPLAQRVAQQAVATAQGHLSASQDPNAPVSPSMIPGLQGLGTGVNVGDLNPLRNVPLLGGVTQGLMRAETLPLQLTGLGQEAFGNVAKATAGAGTAALGGLNAAMQGPGGSLVSALAQTNPATAALANALTLADKIGPHLGQANPLPALAAASQAASNGGNPWERALAAQEASHAASPAQATVGEMAVNPLNFLGPIGDVGAGLRAADNPAALQALGAALQGTARAGELTNAPAEAAFGLAGRRGAFRFGFDPAQAPPTAAQAGQTFAQANAGNTALGATRGNVAYTDLLAGLGEGGKPGLGPALPGLQDLALPPEMGPPAVFRGNVRQPDLIPGLGIGGRPGLGPELPPIQDVGLPPELGPAFPERGNVTGQIGPLLPPSQDVPLPPELGPTLPTRGNVPADQLIARIGRNGGKGIGPAFPDGARRELLGAQTALPPESGVIPADRLRLGLHPDQADFLDEIRAAVQRGDQKEIGAVRDFATSGMQIPADRVSRTIEETYQALGAEDRAARLQAIEGSPYAEAFQYFRKDGTLKPVNPTNGKRIPGAAQALEQVWNLPGSGYDEVADGILARFQYEGHNQNYGQSTDDFWRGAQDAFREYQALKKPAVSAPLPEVLSGGIPASQPIAPVTPEPAALDFGDRAGTIRAVANAPVGHLNAVLADLHNAIYPGQSADFAIPALTGQPRAAFRTSFLTDHPSGNAAEPYLDYLLNRVQKDPKAAARLAEVNPQLADDVSLVAQSDLPLTEHKRLVQALFDVGPQTPAPATPALSGQPGAQAGTLDDLRGLIVGGDNGNMGGYAPNDPAFYAKRLGIPPADVPGMLDQLVQEGTLGKLPDGSLGIKPKPGFLGGMADAAGGGGFGLVPMSTGRVVGGLGGTLVGGGLGFAAPAPDTETRMKRAATGALLGGTLGTGLGSTPQGEALAEEALAGNRAAWQAGSKQIMPTGVSNAVSSLRATQKTALMTIPRNIMDNTIKQALGGKSPVKYLGDLLAQSREWGATLPALRNAGDEQQRMHVMLTSLGPDFANRDPESMARLAVKQGMDYNLDPEDLGTAGAYPPVSAARGAVGALAQPTKLLATGFLTPAVGAAEGVTLAGRAALQNAVLTPADMIGRFAFSMPDYTRQLADAAPAFIKKVAASGQSTALLDQEGRFGASLIKDPTLRAEWEAIQHAAEDAGASVALDHMGDFGTHGAFRKITNNAAPGGVWNIGQSQLLARRAAEHPALATGAIRAAFDNYQRALAAGHPDDAGTATINQDTPGLGLLARLTNGGAAGPLHIPLTYSGSPIGPEVFDVPRQLDPYLHPNQQLYDKIKTITGAAGLGTNPVLDMAAYRLGISDTPHAGASRWAPLGTYAEQAAHAASIPLLGALAENPVADLLNPAAKPGDVQQQLRTNRYLDPAAITAGNEMIYEMRGTSSSDPQNVDLVAQLRDPNSDFYQAALARGLGARAGSALAGEVIPGHPQAQTATAYAAEAAKTALLNQGLPLTRAQVQEIAARPDGGVVLSQIRQAQIDAAKLQDPLLALQDVSSPQDLGAKVFQQWQRENGGLAGFPIVYNILAQREQERLGLVPLGTAMAQQQAYDQLNAGQAYGRPQPYPGAQPLPFDPQPMYDLYRLFGGGR